MFHQLSHCSSITDATPGVLALMITMLSLSIFRSCHSLLESSFFWFFWMPLPFFKGGGGGGITPTWSACSFSKAGPTPREYHRPYTEQPSLIPPQIPRALSRRAGARAFFVDAWIVTSDQSLSMKSCTICKKCKRRKKKHTHSHLRHTFSFLLSLHLLSTDCFQWLTFFSCGHFNIYSVFFFVYYR